MSGKAFLFQAMTSVPDSNSTGIRTQNKQLEPHEAEKLLKAKDSIMRTKWRYSE